MLGVVLVLCGCLGCLGVGPHHTTQHTKIAPLYMEINISFSQYKWENQY